MIFSPESDGPPTRRARRGHAPDASAADSDVTDAELTDAELTDAELTDPELTDADAGKNTNTGSLLFPPDTAEVDVVDPAQQPAAAKRDDLSRALFPTAPIFAPAGHADPLEALPEPEPPREWTDEKNPPTALTWLDTGALAGAADTARTAPDLFTGIRRAPGWLRPRVLLPIGIVAAICATYVGTTLLWPLTSVAPTVQASPVEIAAAPAAAVTWPEEGSAAVGIQGIAPLSSSSELAPIASISKVVSVLMVLDAMPLELGEQGRSFEFTRQDSWDFWSYRRANQSSLDVPVDGSLTEYQMLQGIMLGSANNYIDRLSKEIWGSDREFADASAQWLSDHGIDGITLETPSGFSDDNVATPEALIRVGELAMKNPVFAEIVGTRSVDLPGAGLVSNSNGMLADTGVTGIKTGTLRGDWNLLTSKDITVGDTTVHAFTAVLEQEDNDARIDVTRSLFAEVENALTEQPVSVPKGTVVGHAETEWGERIDIVTDADVSVVLWNGTAAQASTEYDLGEKTDAGAKVGTLTAQGPLNTADTALSLADEITPPSIWWRLTHPLELFGIDKR